SLVEKAIAEIRDPKWAILVAQDEAGEIVSFAKWCCPIEPSENYEEAPWRWPEGTNASVLDAWTEKVETAGERILGDTPCYRKFQGLTKFRFIIISAAHAFRDRS